MVRTTEVLNRNLELLPVPNMLVPRHLLHDPAELVEAFTRLRAKVMPSDLVPMLLWHLAFDAARLDGCEPGDGVFVLLAIENRRVLPRDVDWLEIKRLGLECVEHRHSEPHALERAAR